MENCEILKRPANQCYGEGRSDLLGLLGYWQYQRDILAYASEVSIVPSHTHGLFLIVLSCFY
jgi:hypothetical protein